MAPKNSNPADSNKPENPNEFLEIPKWINEDYFRPIIEKDIEDFASIQSFTPIAATQPGENYSSIMVRVVADILLKDGSAKQISYIIKTTLDMEKGGSLIAEMGFFPKETQMYQVHIPNFTRLYKEAGVDIELAPKCVHIEKTPERIALVLEDLKPQKFHNIDRLQGFDLPQMRRVLRKVAELHAASAVAFEQFGPYDELYNQSFYVERNRSTFTRVMNMRHETYITAMRQWQLPEVDKYIELLTSPAEYFDMAMELNKVDESEFNCLNHGDLWCNNIMFSGDRTLFVDLQVGKWGSPAQDLWYMITTSASLDIKVKEFDHFIQIYHQRLEECLKLLKYSKHIPTLREFHVTMLKYGNWGPTTSRSLLALILKPSDKDSSINMMMTPGPEGDAFRYQTFTNPYYAKAMVQLYPFYKNKGLLQKV